MNIANETDVINILKREKLAYVATTNGKYVDNAVVCYASENLDIYFGCYEDTLKGKNIRINPHVALAIGPLQIHGLAEKIEYKSPEYDEKIRIYGEKWPEYVPVFEKENNELYQIKPLVVWKYDSSKGEMNRDVLILDNDYYHELKPYEAKKEYKKKN